jgi:hypothetical protein
VLTANENFSNLHQNPEALVRPGDADAAFLISALASSGTKQMRTQPKESMLWTIFVILLVLWLLGLVSSYTMGGFIHILLVIAVVILIINLIQGRRTL